MKYHALFVIFEKVANFKLSSAEGFNAHTDISIRARCPNSGLSLYLHPYFVYASSKGLEILHICEGSSEPSLFEKRISTKIFW